MFNKLLVLRNKLTQEYTTYTQGLISQQEYLNRIKPIDIQIDELEMSTLQDSFVLPTTSSKRLHKQ